jgi:hypothetical protein
VASPEPPASLLERAARRVDELAESATPAPWGSGLELCQTLKIHRDDGNWISAMSPALAVPLAEMLRDAAHRMRRQDHLDPNGSTYQRCALDIAQAILGTPVPGEDV